MVSDEGLLRAACIARDAAADSLRASYIMQESVQALRVLLEDGYGGNGAMLLEHLRRIEVPK